MKIEYVDRIENSAAPRTKWKNIFDEFIRTDRNAAKLIYENGEYKNAITFYVAARAAVIRCKYNLSVIMRNGEVYLVKNIK